MKLRNYLVIKTSEVILVIATLLFCFAFKLHAQVQPSKLFSSGMVLQRNIDIKIWGTGTARASVSVTFNNNTVDGKVTGDGNWNITLPQMEAGGPYAMTITSGTQTLNYSDVYVGDVWIASGQSNMELTVSQADSATTEIASASNPMIRQFKIPKTLSDEPSDIVPTGSVWTAANKSNVGNFTAAGYYFAKALNKELNVPIGIINTSYGGSRIEAWMSEKLLGYDEQDVILQGGTYQERQPTKCYNQMLKPLEGLPIKGFIWYQGESNADNMEDAIEYGGLFKKMITGWREAWGMGDLPFLWVQLPNFSQVYDEPQTWDAWPKLRENQNSALSLPNTGDAVTIDLGDVDIHPTHKQGVGQRLALAALKVAYEQNIEYSGPRYKSHYTTSDHKVVVKFDHTGSGLIAKGSSTGEVTGFAVASSSGALSWANATLSGDSVIVWNNNVPSPSIVRYAWEYNPVCNLYNAENLPASPFKIDITDPGFVITNFSSSASEIERGQNAVLTWETHGAETVTLDDETVEAISGKRIFPQETTTYILKSTSEKGETLTKSITVTVVDPKPTIVVSTDVGGIASPGTEITLKATVTAPKGRTVKQVDFYIDNVLIGTDTESPYEMKWTPETAGEFSLTGKVTDNTDVSVISQPSAIYVTKLKMIYYEAEDASWTGTGSVKSSSTTSGKKYLDLQSGWILTFANVEAPETDVYPLTIRYLLNYESPKAQTLIVNGNTIGDITFTAPNTTTWMTYVENVSLNKGTNTIVFDGSWEWMSFDYIAIAVEDTSTVGASNLNENRMQLNTYPNPASNTCNISYFVPEEGKVVIDIYSADGKKMKSILNEVQSTGSHSINFDASLFQSGVYVVKMTMDAAIGTQRFAVKR